MNISGARVLITHTQTQGIMGSTVVALELATYLRDNGASVEVYAGATGNPGGRLFQEREIHVECDIEHEYQLSDYDLVWVHSQVLPLSMVRQLANVTPSDRVPAFVFNHMTALDFAADEHPYLYLLEEQLAAKMLFVSPESRDKLLPHYHEVPNNIDIYPNPAPVEFGQLVRNPSDKLRRVLVVSNHVPSEVWDAIEVLRRRGIDVEIFGEQGRYSLVTPQVLEQFDAVITIGKTVQYCLTAGIPVYVYDHFGGFGYLDEENLVKAAERNFSGRGGNRYTGAEIAESLESAYVEALEFATVKRGLFIERYSIDRMLPRVLGDVEPRSLQPLEQSYMLTLCSAQRFAHRYYEVWAAMNVMTPERNELRRALDESEHSRQQLEACLNAQQDVQDSLERRIREIEESEAYQFGRRAMLVPHAVKNAVGRLLRLVKGR